MQRQRAASENKAGMRRLFFRTAVIFCVMHDLNGAAFPEREDMRWLRENDQNTGNQCERESTRDMRITASRSNIKEEKK